MKARSDFDIDSLGSALSYDQYNGKISWKISTGKAKRGSIAGIVSAAGYMKITYLGRTYAGHRIAWALHYRCAPPDVIDHINGDKLDNRIENLRDGTDCVNQQNQKYCHSRNETSKLLGVSMLKGRWRAKIYHKGKYIFLGYHATEELAGTAYAEAKRKIHDGCTM